MEAVFGPGCRWKKVLAALAVRMMDFAQRTYKATKILALQGTCYFPTDHREHLPL